MSVYLLSMFSGIVDNIPTKSIISLLGLIVLDYITGELWEYVERTYLMNLI